MKKISRFLASVLTLSLVFGNMNMVYADKPADDVLAAETYITEEGRTVINGFEYFDIRENTIYVNQSEYPSLYKLTKMMPQELGVYVGDQLTYIPVTWKCATDDYEEQKYYSYQFNPVLDEKFILADSYLEKEMPYVEVFVIPDENADGEVGIDAVTSNANEPKVYNFLTGTMGLNSAAACGIMANIKAESGFRTTAVGDNGTSYGLCQWHNGRWTNLNNFCSNNGYDPSTVEGQMNFLWYELRNSYKGVWNKVNTVANTKDGAYDAAYYWCYNFEIPANRASVSVTRGNTARDTFWPEYGRPSETNPPEISDVKVYASSSTAFTVSCRATDATGVSSVRFPTWTEKNDQDDLIWHTGAQSGDTWSVTIDISEHKSEYGKYITHIYAYDVYDNYKVYAMVFWLIKSADGGYLVISSTEPETTPPSISDIEVLGLNSTTFKVSCKVTDNVKVSRVKFPTWTEKNDQDEIIWYDGYKSGDTWYCTVKLSEHNSEYGRYITHIYAYDSSENLATEGTSYTISAGSPLVINGGNTPTPGSTPTPKPSSTVSATATPGVGPSATATPGVGPSATATPSGTIAATEAPEPEVDIPELNPEAGDVVTKVNLITSRGIQSVPVVFMPDYAEDYDFYTMSGAGNKAVLKKKLTKRGYTFKGWTLDGKKVTAINEKNLRPGMVLRANFVPVVYNVNYKIVKPLGVTKIFGKIVMSKSEKKVPYTNETFRVRGSEISAPGYTLAGWSTIKNSTTPMVLVGQEAKIDDLIPLKGKNINLYPVWEAGQEEDSKAPYLDFVNGKIKDTDGNDINYYLDQPFDHVYYYFIKAKDAKHEAMVLCCETAWTGNYIYYYENGEMICKATFGRRATSGSGLYAGTYILYDATSPCSCSISTVEALDENYNLTTVKNFYYPSSECNEGHETFYMEGFERLSEPEDFTAKDYVAKYLHVTEGEELYHAPDYAIKIK